jgi:membrane protein
MALPTIVEMFKRTAQRFFAKNTFEMGAALAYFTVFSLAPLLLIAVSIAGLIFGEKAAHGQMAAEIENAVGPTVANAIQEILKHAHDSGGSTTASVVGLVLLLFGASGVFVQLQSSLNAIWDVEPKAFNLRAFIRHRLLTFAMVLGIGFLLLVSLVINTAISAMGNYLAPQQTAVAQGINQLLSFAVITLLFALIFRVLPDRSIAWEDVWVGAAFTSLLFVTGKYLLGLYLARGSVTSAYGAAGSLVVILVWVYYASQILLFGAQFTQVYTTQRHQIRPNDSTNHPSLHRATTDAARPGGVARTEI